MDRVTALISLLTGPEECGDGPVVADLAVRPATAAVGVSTVAGPEEYHQSLSPKSHSTAPEIKTFTTSVWLTDSIFP